MSDSSNNHDSTTTAGGFAAFTLLVACFGILILGSIYTLYYSTQGSPESRELDKIESSKKPDIVELSALEGVKIGMSMGEVKDVVRAKGEEEFHEDDKGRTSYLLYYYNDYSSVRIKFDDTNKVVSIVK